MRLPDFVRSGNQAVDPELYDVENAAFDRRGLVLAAMRELAPWAGRRLVDLGCGSGYWLPGYADEAAEVIGVEPDETLLPLALARFAYFFGAGADAGLAEVRRVLSPGGSLVVVDNDPVEGEFAALLRAGGLTYDAASWWRAHEAIQRPVLSDWTFDNRAGLEAVLRLEFPGGVAEGWLREHLYRTSLTYGYILYAVTNGRLPARGA